MHDAKVVKRIILDGLITPPRWGGKHTDVRNLKKGFPSNFTSTKEGQKLIDNAIKELINDSWLLAKKSTGELHVSLNPKMKKEIMEFISKQ
ncbi:hypothetical protein HYY74_07895 [Candidatus Woesearchaeota archaeon]|nr:hypothetical protein [Candidatus Woesearchaeota archaeon]